MRLTERLGIELPIVQAPMAGIQGGRLAAAVSAAGGLGSIPCAMLSAEQIVQEVGIVRDKTGAPFNLNFFCHRMPGSVVDHEWRRELEPYYEEFGIDASSVPAGPTREPFSDESMGLLEALVPKVASFHFGLPAPEFVARIKQLGIVVMSSATTVEEAVYLEANGADVVIAQGVEAGGHRGMFLATDIASQPGLFALLPQVCAAVSVPVIAAGGIATPAGVGAALALGAEAVQPGTAYLLCPEADTSAIHRASLRAEGAAGETVLTNVFSGRPARAIVNRLVREKGPMSAFAPPFPHAMGAVAPLRKLAEGKGSGDFSPLWSGQNNAFCSETPATELTRQLGGGAAL